MKLGFKRTVNWNKYQSKGIIQTQIIYLIQVCRERIDFLFYHLKMVHSEQYTQHCTKNEEILNGKVYFLRSARSFLPTAEIKVYNVMIDEKSIFDQPVKIDTITYENIQNVAIFQGDGYTAGYLLDYRYFKK